MANKIKYFRVFSEGAWKREDIAKNLTMKAWFLLKGENPCFFDVTKPSTDKEELLEKAREERERIRWSQSYSRNPRKMVHKVYIHEVDADGKYILTKRKRMLLSLGQRLALWKTQTLQWKMLKFSLHSKELKMKQFETPKDIPIGTILVQHWCNSSSFFKVIGTTNKSVLVVKMPSKQTHFDHEGGGTGYSYKLPDEEAMQKLEDAYEAYNKKYGFDIFKASQEQFNDAKKTVDYEEFLNDYVDIINNRQCLVPKRIMIRPLVDGGFYIPGYFRGSMCGPMKVWNGEEVFDYYN